MPGNSYQRIMRFTRIQSFTAIVLAWLSGASSAWCAVDYAKDIRPVLKARCYACHGALKQKSGLRLDTVASMRKGGESGDVIKAEKSILLDHISAAKEEDRMPPEGAPLTPQQINSF